MLTNAELHSRRERAVARGVAHACHVYPEKAKNAEIWDVEGRRYIDFASGIAVMNVGHGHPRVIEAARRQLERFVHPSFQVTPYEVYVALAERVCALAPGDGPKKAAFFSTGAEAVENAVKIARAHTRRRAIITFSGGFHGRTLLTLAMTGKVNPYKIGVGPFPGEVYHVPFPMEYRGIDVRTSLAALDSLFNGDVAPEDVAAIVIEPVLGEGGFYIAPPEFLRELSVRCGDAGIVFVVDEIQSGFARTGRMFAVEHAGIEPDLMTIAKSLAGGFPLSGVLGRAAIMDSVGPGGLGGTYGGNPVACAAALEVLDVIHDEHLAERAVWMGETMRSRLGAVAERTPLIGDVRGLGAMVAIELVRDRATRQPAPEAAAAVARMALDLGLVVITAGLYGNVIRLLAPLTIPESILDEGLSLLARAFAGVSDA